MNEKSNAIFWAYNLPLQWWPIYEDPENLDSPIIGYEFLNYVPRLQKCVMSNFDDPVVDVSLTGNGWEKSVHMLKDYESISDFLNHAAKIYDNLARLFRESALDPNKRIYYPTEGTEDN